MECLKLRCYQILDEMLFWYLLLPFSTMVRFCLKTDQSKHQRHHVLLGLLLGKESCFFTPQVQEGRGTASYLDPIEHPGSNHCKDNHLAVYKLLHHTRRASWVWLAHSQTQSLFPNDTVSCLCDILWYMMIYCMYSVEMCRVDVHRSLDRWMDGYIW